MGVPGLTTFLDSNTQILLDYKLKDIKIIVDGNNLLHFLYNFYQIPFSYGGDYTIFADSCRRFFSSLKESRVEPCVVLDGAYDLDGKKFNSSRLRTAKKVTVSLNNTKDRSTFLVPLLTHEVFKDVLNELSIKHVTCNYEADRQIASLAAKWKCPVLTNDSDFFIFDLPGGVILLDYFNVAIKTDDDGTSYMDVQLYSVDKLKKEMGIYDHSLIFLFATVMGNDVISGDTFNPFCKKLNYFSHVPGIKLNQIPNHRRKIFGLLKWLALKRNSGAAIRDILFELNCDSDKENKLREIIKKSVENYSTGETYLDVIFENYNDILSSLETFSKIDTGKLVNKNNEEVPLWFKMQFNYGILNSKLANVFVSHRVLLQPQIENRSDPSSHVCTFQIRELLYGLLLRYSTELEVVEFCRGFSKLDKIKTKPRWTLMNDDHLPILDDLYTLPESKKKSIILDLFSEDQKWFLDYPEKEQFFLATLIFWCNHAIPKLSRFHIWSMLICFYAAEVVTYLKDPHVDMLSSDDVATAISDFLGTRKGKQKYFELFDIQGFAQFQTCFLSLLEVNTLLQNPIRKLSLATFYNGSVLMYIYYYLESELTRTDEFLKEIFVNNMEKLDYISNIFRSLDGVNLDKSNRKDTFSKTKVNKNSKKKKR